METDRLLLRRFTLDDALFALRLLNEPSFIQNIGDRGVRDLQQAVRYLAEGPLASYARHGHGLEVVALRATQQPIGMCGLLKRDAFPDVDVGYAFLPEFWSQGYAREAVAATLLHGRQELGIARVLAFVSLGNASSIRLLEKFGFAPSGRTRMSPDALDEVLVYQLSF
jgi:RimJ/RimL family protein N-acetyltransferase